MDFYEIVTKETKHGLELKVQFKVMRSEDIMIRGGGFYAVWDEATNFWTTDIYKLYDKIRKDVRDKIEALREEGYTVHGDFDEEGLSRLQRYLRGLGDNFHRLDEKIAFANYRSEKRDYMTRKLSYELGPGDISAWNELLNVLYAKDEKAKIEWTIGAIVSGDSKDIQKFLVFYGGSGTGKSTVINIISKLFDGYTTTFDAKALGQGSRTFAMEAFRHNPLVAIQHDGDLSRIDDNTRLNSIVSHEVMTLEEKFKSPVDVRLNSFLIMGTNTPVKISDSRSGLVRRLIDVQPTGKKLPFDDYQTLLSRIEFEYGAIADHCLKVYKRMGKTYYDGYKPTDMMYSTNVVFNFVTSYLDELNSAEGITLKRAWVLFKQFCEESGNEPGKMQVFREELREYYDEYMDRKRIGEERARNVYVGFKMEKLTHGTTKALKKEKMTLRMEETTSLLDTYLASMPAQYANKVGNPITKWANVSTTLADIDTSKLHFVKVPENHVVIDFDIKDEDGEKSLDLNVEAASEWPLTYAELSKSGKGIHLHYIYHGDISELSSEYSPGIEIKTLRGDASLRRKLTYCNKTAVAILTSGLPTKEKKKMLDIREIKSEKSLRELIERNMRKEIHPGTKPSIDFIKKILDDAYSSDLSYDVTDLRSRIIAFANNSTNRPLECLKIVQQMQFKSDTPMEESVEEAPVVFFDVEVYPNLFVVCFKRKGEDEVTKMINPTAQDVEKLFSMRLIGFNNRRYDNHILYARFLGYDNPALYNLSQKIVANENKSRDVLFGEAYNLSYADVYDFSSKKQGLKKFQIELGLHHSELDVPWDQPVPEERWGEVAEYCANDVVTTEGVFEARYQDFVARQILSEISGLPINETTQRHTARIIFGNDRNPQAQFVYSKLDETFPGYTFDAGKSLYRGEDPSEGGYVYAEKGIYTDVAVLDVASMHPTSIIQLNLFGPYTRNFQDLVRARLAIKNHDYKTARKLLHGKLAKFVDDSDDSADALSHALKIVINIVYGLTSAKFDNPFRDNRNRDNIVAKRGALFMIDLKHAVQERGYQVVHIKTDSIKIPNADETIIQFVKDFGASYGYTFEHEKTYDKFCLVNDAVYVARTGDKWDAVGAQFQHPYVYKSLFSKEVVDFDSLCEIKSVMQGSIYLETDGVARFIGRTGCFVPVVAGSGGGALYRVKDDKKYAVTGTKGFLWKEAEVVRELGPDSWMHIDLSYYTKLVEEAVKTIEEFGSFEEFVS